MATLLQILDDDDRAELQGWLEAPDISHKDISASLGRAGISRSPYQVMWHRNRNCRCYL
jgi:hypothetical protein